MHPWLNWIEHRPPKAGTARSNRAGCARNSTAAWRFNLCSEPRDLDAHAFDNE